MSTEEVAKSLISLCREGKFEEAIKDFYGENIKSIEAFGEPKEVEGIEAVRAKSEYFAKSFEVHGLEVSDPIVSGNFFSCKMVLDATNKETGERAPMDEICIYEVKDGKIVFEQFFYGAP